MSVDVRPAAPQRSEAAASEGPAAPSGLELPLVSVVVPVRNEESHIARVLGRLGDQDYPAGRFEVIVVDGQSTDNTVATVQKFVESHRNVRLLPNPARLSSAGRNVGIRAARGDIIVIVDGHCELEDDQFLRKHVAAFDRSGADCLGRPQPLELSGATALQRAIAAARSSWLGHHPASHIYSSRERFVPAASVAAAYRRSVFDRVGYFDESFDACEDYELNTRIDRAGLRCYFTPDITVRYRPRDSLAALFRQLVRYGRGRARLMRKHPSTISLGSLLPALFVLFLLLGLPASFVSPWLAVGYCAALSAYIVLVLAVSAAIGLRLHSPKVALLLPAVFAAIHIAAGAGALLDWTGAKPNGAAEVRNQAAEAARRDATTGLRRDS